MDKIAIGDGQDEFARATYAKVTRRLMPILFLCYILAYLDRVNVGFAKLGMHVEPWFSDAIFATGSGIFFIGYLLFEVPGNIIMHRLGARVWMTRIMITWGIISACCALSAGKTSFYTLRFMLGLAEAGFFPGIILYLTYWFPDKQRARIVALFMTAVAFAGIVGSPLSGWILKTASSWSALKPWQWLYIIEGIPSILLGLSLPFILRDGPEKAGWLTPEEIKLLRSHHDEDDKRKSNMGWEHHGIRDAFGSWKIWVFSLIYFSFVVGMYGISFWLPQIIENTMTKDKFQIGLLAAIPWTCAVIGMVIFGKHSDRTGERRIHITAMAFTGMLAFILSGLPGLSPVGILLSLSVATTAAMCVISAFWSMPSAVLSGAAAAAGFALINSVGNLSGYFSPQMFAWLKQHYSLGAGLIAAGLSMGIGGILTWFIWSHEN